MEKGSFNADKCRLCGKVSVEKMLMLQDAYCFNHEVKEENLSKTILDFLQERFIILKIQPEYECLMPQFICIACFNVALDIDSFMLRCMKCQEADYNDIISSVKRDSSSSYNRSNNIKMEAFDKTVDLNAIHTYSDSSDRNIVVKAVSDNELNECKLNITSDSNINYKQVSKQFDTKHDSVISDSTTNLGHTNPNMLLLEIDSDFTDNKTNPNYSIINNNDSVSSSKADLVVHEALSTISSSKDTGQTENNRILHEINDKNKFCSEEHCSTTKSTNLKSNIFENVPSIYKLNCITNSNSSKHSYTIISSSNKEISPSNSEPSTKTIMLKEFQRNDEPTMEVNKMKRPYLAFNGDILSECSEKSEISTLSSDFSNKMSESTVESITLVSSLTNNNEIVTPYPIQIEDNGMTEVCKIKDLTIPVSEAISIICDMSAKNENNKTSLLTKPDTGTTAISFNKKNYKKNVNKIWECSDCGKQFSKNSQLKYHERSHGNLRPFICDICGVALKYKRNLDEHMRLHNNATFVCSLCGLKFKQKSNLIKHEMSHSESNIKKYSCRVCNKAFRQTSHLNLHIKTVHEETKMYRCDECGVEVKLKSSLNRHILQKHSNQVKYVCSVCGKTFNNKQNYEGHTRSHSRDKPFKCFICDKCFATKRALMRHKMIHGGLRSHKCLQCPKSFLESTDLKRHLLSHARRQTMGKGNAKNSPQEADMNLMVLTDPVLFSQNELNSTIDFQKTDASTTDIDTNSVTIEREANIINELEEPEVIEASHLIDSGQMLPATPIIAQSQVFNQDSVFNHTQISANEITLPHPLSTEESEHIGLNEQSIVSMPICEDTSDQTNVVMLAPVDSPEHYLRITSCRTNDELLEAKQSISNPLDHQSERVLSQAKW